MCDASKRKQQQQQLSSSSSAAADVGVGNNVQGFGQAADRTPGATVCRLQERMLDKSAFLRRPSVLLSNLVAVASSLDTLESASLIVREPERDVQRRDLVAAVG